MQPETTIRLTLALELDPLTAAMLEHWASCEELDICTAVQTAIEEFVEHHVELQVHDDAAADADRTKAPWE